MISFDEDDKKLIIKREQYIPDEMLSALRREREDSLSTPAGEFHRVASIPTAVVDKWLSQGFDIYKAPVEDILLRLRLEELEGFITSKKV